MAQEKTPLYNLADLKATTDDAIANYLNSIKFTQSHFKTDVRLALGYSAFLISGVCFLWDYKLGFDRTKYYTAVAVALYSALNGALTYWINRVEQGTVYQGSTPTGEEIYIASSTKKYEPTYLLKVATLHKKDRKVLELSNSFTEWFDETGLFVPRPFQELLATSIPVVGKQDPKRVKTASEKLLDANPDLLDAVLAANTAGESTATPNKGSTKRRKN